MCFSMCANVFTSTFVVPLRNALAPFVVMGIKQYNDPHTIPSSLPRVSEYLPL